jgi:hypothetical protein
MPRLGGTNFKMPSSNFRLASSDFKMPSMNFNATSSNLQFGGGGVAFKMPSGGSSGGGSFSGGSSSGGGSSNRFGGGGGNAMARVAPQRNFGSSRSEVAPKLPSIRSNDMPLGRGESNLIPRGENSVSPPQQRPEATQASAGVVTTSSSPSSRNGERKENNKVSNRVTKSEDRTEENNQKGKFNDAEQIIGWIRSFDKPKGPSLINGRPSKEVLGEFGGGNDIRGLAERSRNAPGTINGKVFDRMEGRTLTDVTGLAERSRNAPGTINGKVFDRMEGRQLTDVTGLAERSRNAPGTINGKPFDRNEGRTFTDVTGLAERSRNPSGTINGKVFNRSEGATDVKGFAQMDEAAQAKKIEEYRKNLRNTPKTKDL